MTSFHLLDLRSVPIYEQLQIEEALLRTDNRNWCLLNQGSSDAIVMGISARIPDVIHVDEVRKQPVALIRRFSGGGTVYVDEATCFVTFIANADEIGVPCHPHAILHWTGLFYTSLCSPDRLRIVENDYVVGEKKCGGNAQYIQRGRWLHHTTFLWDFCPAKMRSLAFPPRTPSYRLGRSHEEFLCPLKTWYPEAEALMGEIRKNIESRYLCHEMERGDILSHLKKAHRQATIRLEIE